MDSYKAKKILDSNLTKTMGCTDIGVVGYIASIGAYILRNNKIKSVDLVMSEELYKNSVNVGVPGLRKSGLDKALALGILLKNPNKQLSVFESVTNDDIEKITDEKAFELLLKNNKGKVLDDGNLILTYPKTANFLELSFLCRQESHPYNPNRKILCL